LSFVGLIAPLELEARCLGRLRVDPSFQVAVSGVGPNAALAAARKLAGQGAGALVSWGMAAGLTGSVSPGDLVVAERVLDGDESLIGSPQWVQDLERALVGSKVRMARGAICGLTAPLQSPLDKRVLGQSALAADMESVAVARVACAHGLPWLVCRVVVDGVNDRVPNAALAALVAGVGTRAALVPMLFSLLDCPADWPCMLRLAENARRARRTLKRVARVLTGPAGCG